MLGLRLSKLDHKALWATDNKVKTLEEIKTKRDEFTFRGQLIVQLPVASWLQPMCSFLKR